MALSKEEKVFATVISLSHGVQHFFMRLVPPLIPILVVDLEYPLWVFGLLVSIYSVSDGVFQAVFGVLSDRYDRRYILAPGIGAMGVGYLVFALAPRIGLLLPSITLRGTVFDGPYLIMCVSMLIAGAGGSVLHPTGYPLITENSALENKGRILGLWGSTAKFGDAAAPGLIGILTLVLVWSEMVFIFGLLGIGYAIVLFFILGQNRFDTLPRSHRLKETDDDGERDDEETADETSVWKLDRRVFIYPMVVILLFFFARIIATRGVDTFIPQFVTSVYGYSYTFLGYEIPPEAVANFYFTVLLVMAGVMQLLTGYLTDKYDPRSVLIWFLTVSALALAVLSYIQLTPLALLLVLLVIGAGLWGHNPARDALISEITPARLEGRTFGYVWSGTLVIAAISPIFIGYVADTTSIQNAFKFLALAALVAAGSIILLYSSAIYLRAGKAAEQATD